MQMQIKREMKYKMQMKGLSMKAKLKCTTHTFHRFYKKESEFKKSRERESEERKEERKKQRKYWSKDFTPNRRNQVSLLPLLIHER